MQYFVKCLENYANFKGRATRKEYWMYYLFYTILYLVVWSIDAAGMVMENKAMSLVGSALIFLFTLGLLVPTWAVCIRRLHDVGKSGWYILVNLIPIIGCIWFFILMCTDSQSGTNKYGDNPKGM